MCIRDRSSSYDSELTVPTDIVSSNQRGDGTSSRIDVSSNSFARSANRSSPVRQQLQADLEVERQRANAAEASVEQLTQQILQMNRVAHVSNSPLETQRSRTAPTPPVAEESQPLEKLQTQVISRCCNFASVDVVHSAIFVEPHIHTCNHRAFKGTIRVVHPNTPMQVLRSKISDLELLVQDLMRENQELRNQMENFMTKFSNGELLSHGRNSEVDSAQATVRELQAQLEQQRQAFDQTEEQYRQQQAKLVKQHQAALYVQKEKLTNTQANSCLLYTSPSPRDRG